MTSREEFIRKLDSIKRCLPLIGAICIFIGIVLGAGISLIVAMFFMPTVSDALKELANLMSSSIIIVVLVLAIFLFVLCRFFNDKKKGYGLYTTSTLLMILALMVTLVGLLLGKIDSGDTTNIMLAIVGFAGGLLARGKQQ